MKLNNKGFAITTILYGTLILFLMLLLSMLAILSTYKDRLGMLIDNNNGARCIINKNCKGGETKKIINFTIDGIGYQAEENITWGEWIESDYNTIDAFTCGGLNTNVCYGDYVLNDGFGVYIDSIIVDGREYYNE